MKMGKIVIFTWALFVLNFQLVQKAEAYPSNSFLTPRKIEKIDTKTRIRAEICRTPGCISAASSMEKWMDTAVNPCDDFYKFACGKYMQDTIPNEMSDNFDVLSDKVKLVTRKNIEKDINENDPTVFKKIRSFYYTCMNTPEIERVSKDNLLEILKEVGGWPMLKNNSWNASNFDWKKTIYKLNSLGYSVDSIFFKTFVNPTSHNKKTLIIKKAKHILDLGEGVRENYYYYMLQISQVFGINFTEAIDDFKGIYKFELDLANIKDSEDIIPVSIDDFQLEYPDISWKEYFVELLAPHMSLEILNSSNLVVNFDLKSFFKLLSKTPKRVLTNYMMWTVVTDLSLQMGGSGQKETEQFFTFLGLDVFNPKPRWKECIEIIEEHLPLALSALYSRKNFDKHSKKNIDLIATNLKKSLRNLISKVDWMDEETKKVARKKLDHISEHIAYPQEFEDDKILDEYHQKLKIYPNNYLRSFLSINGLMDIYANEVLLKISERNHWIYHGLSRAMNVHYNPIVNSFDIPAAILQDVFFSNDRPQYLNYGAIGHIIGHELVHSLDKEDKLFGKERNLTDWRVEKSQKEYKKRSKEIIMRYSNYIVEEINSKINGNLTLQENIADIGGIKTAYNAYVDWEKEHKVEPQLPGFNYTSHQMFWISAATTWCSKFEPIVLEQMIKDGPHSPHKYRVIGMVSNMREFSGDFDCLPESNMNPPEKYGIWR